MAKKKQPPIQITPPKPANRAVAVFVCLIAVVAFTSLLLVALAPPPLQTSMWRSLFAVDAPESLDAIFQTQMPTVDGRWRHIYIHHSMTPGGDAAALAKSTGFDDHFVIGNGDGCVDGEIQMTQIWNRQESIANTPGGIKMDGACVSICVIGDLDRTLPTPTQQRRLTQLVDTLQARLHIPASRINLVDQPGSPVGIGHSFPTAAFRTQVLP